MAEMPDAKKLYEMENLMYYMECELDGAREGFAHLYEVLFEGNCPNTAYTINYFRLQSMYHLFLDTLFRFSGKFGMLQGDEENGTIEFEEKQLADLRLFTKPHRTKDGAIV